MSPPSSRDQFSDPNEHLLASVIPPPPPTLRARAQQLLTRLRQRDRLRVLDWSRSREGRACFLAALAGGALMLGLYRSGASSGMNAGGATLRSEPSPAAGSEPSPAVGSERPRALEPERTHAALLPAVRADAVEPKSSLARAAGDDPERADATSVEASLGSTKRHAGADEKLDETKAAKKKKRRAKQRAVRRKHTRATRRSKARRAKAARPVPGWLANQRSKKASGTD